MHAAMAEQATMPADAYNADTDRAVAYIMENMGV